VSLSGVNSTPDFSAYVIFMILHILRDYFHYSWERRVPKGWDRLMTSRNRNPTS
jgi:hypothetical protein